MSKIIPIPGTKFVVLEDDLNLTPKAMAAKTICVEMEVLNLPIVLGLEFGNVVVDVGAFIGDTARFFLDKGCEVFAFEPMPDAFSCLLHNCPEATNINAAAGDGRPVCLHNNPLAGNLGTRTVSLNEDGEISVKIDELPLTRCDFLKIDCEGFEPLVLDGAIETVKKFKPPILIEAYDAMLEKNGFTRHDILKRLFRMGYTVRIAIGAEDEPRVDYLAFF